jgi:hypothetical protein
MSEAKSITLKKVKSHYSILSSAGFVLAKLGANLDESQSVLKSLKLSEDSTGLYPSGIQRLEADRIGWESAK